MKSINIVAVSGCPHEKRESLRSLITKEFSGMGYSVLFTPDCSDKTEDISNVILHQKKAEETVLKEADSLSCEKVLIVSFSGIPDILAGTDRTVRDDFFKNSEYGSTLLRDSYDAAFLMQSEEIMCDTDSRRISEWTGNPHFRVIPFSDDESTQENALIKEIAWFLGEPEPLEIERKYLIEYPCIKALEDNPHCKGVEISQSYLSGRVRIRKRGADGNYIYFRTMKKDITPVKRIETEERITESEYTSLLESEDVSGKQINKIRYCLMWENQYFEIDVFPFWNDKALMEIELCDENAEIRFPDFIKIIKEVTDDPDYRNSSLTRLAKQKN